LFFYVHFIKSTAANKCYTKAGQRSAIEQLCIYLSFVQG